MNGTQVRNLFYVKRIAKANPGDPDLGTVPGDLIIVSGGGANAPKAKLSGKEYIQLKYVNPDGKLIVSDFIVKDQATAKAVAGKGTKLKKAVLKLKEDPIAGEDYIVDILVHNYQTIAENSVLAKYGVAHAITGMSKGKLLLQIAKSFAMNFRRDAHLNDFFTFSLAIDKDDATTYKPVLFNSKEEDFTTTEESGGETVVTSDIDDYLYLIITEKKQTTWYRGTFPMQTVHFDVAPHTVISNGDEVQPFETDGESGLVKIEATSTVIPNGYDMADLEYECHGEIGDQLREAGYPNNIRTKYAISDADVEKMFDSVELYFYYIGRNTSVQKAEKQLTLAIEQGAQGAHTLTAAVASTITSAGVTVDTSDIQ